MSVRATDDARTPIGDESAEALPLVGGKRWPLEMSAEEFRAFFDAAVGELIGLSGDDYLARRDTDFSIEKIDDGEHEDLVFLWMLSQRVR